MLHSLIIMKKLIPGVFSLVFLFGCATTSDHSEFVRTVTFSSFQSFDYKHTLVTGMDFRESEEMMLEELSETSLKQLFEARGFSQVSEAPDFYVVAKWQKAVSSYPDIFDQIDGPLESIDRRDNPSLRFASRLHLTVEAYEAKSDALFWRKELPNIFDATQFTQERIVASLERAVKNFPERVEKDPSLPDIE